MNILQPKSQGCNPIKYQQLNLAFEPRQLYQPDKRSGRFALCHKMHGQSKITQELFDIKDLDFAVKQVASAPEHHRKHFWISQATLKPWATNRRIASIAHMNAIWVDIDIAHPHKGFDMSKMFIGTPEKLAGTLAFQLEMIGWPPPSYIISTGGGLCAKYVFTDALPAIARARWQSLQRYFIKKIAEMELGGLSWPVDYAASDAARVLRLPGTHNPRWNEPCRIVWDSGKRYDVDYLSEFILPYTREQLEEFNKNRSVYKEWDKNRAKASAQGLRRAVAVDSEDALNEAMDDELVRAMWCRRLEFGRAVLEHRGGVQEGSRNNYFWPMGNALAYSCGGAEQLTQELASLHKEYFKSDGWTRAEAMHSASTVAKRLKNDDLYKMKNSTFREKLEVSSTEWAAFGWILGGSSSKKKECNVGIMGFEKMRGLESDAYLAETRRRQREAGKQIGVVNLLEAAKYKANANEDKRAKAVLMRASGCTQSHIAQELEVSQQSVSRWLK